MGHSNDRPGRRFWRLVSPVLAYFAVNLLVSFVASWIMTRQYIAAEGVGDTDALTREIYWALAEYTTEITALVAVLVIPVMILFMREDIRRDYIAGTREVYEQPQVLTLAAAALLGIAAAVTGNNLLAISGLTETYSQAYEELGAALYRGRILVEIAGIGIAAPVAEELVFRGVLLKRMLDYMPQKAAVVTSSLIFAIIHPNTPQKIYAALLGLLLGFVYVRTHSVRVPVALHIGANLFSVIASETGVLDAVTEKGGLAFSVYAFGGAMLTLFLLYFMYAKVETKLLIPAAGPPKEDS